MPVDSNGISKTRLIVWVTLLVFIFIQNNFKLDSSIGVSMQPTYNENSVGLYRYRNSEIKRNDIVLIRTEPIKHIKTDNEFDFLMKRVIGVPGDIIMVYNDQLYINNKRIKEKYILEDMRANKSAITILGDDEFFVMGDNRNNSYDSRDFGAIRSSWIMAKRIYDISE